MAPPQTHGDLLVAAGTATVIVAVRQMLGAIARRDAAQLVSRIEAMERGLAGAYEAAHWPAARPQFEIVGGRHSRRL